MLGLGSDHNGYELKERLCAHMPRLGLAIRDFGTFSPDPVDYPDIAIPVAEAVASGEVEGAVLICRTGLGMAIAANKVPGVFAASVTDIATAVAARRSNDARVIALGAQFVPCALATQIVHAWLSTEFQGGDSARKLAKIRDLERRYWRVPVALAIAG